MKKRKTIVSLILSVAMLFGTLPSGMVFAADTSQYTVSLTASAETVDSGNPVNVSVNVTSGSQTNYNAFYAVLSYDSRKFAYSGGSDVNGFSVDSSTDGTLKISRVGSVVSISDIPDLSLTFTAKVGGKGNFFLSSAKVDTAANAEQDAPEATIGSSIEVMIPQNVVEIRTEKELRDFAASVNAGNDYLGSVVTLMNNITLSDKWIPIGTEEYPFRGDFDGQNYLIDGINIDIEWEGPDLSTIYAGLFGYICNSTVQDVKTKGTVKVSIGEPVNYRLPLMYAAGLVAYAESGTKIIHCENIVDVSVNNLRCSIGGVVGVLGEYGSEFQSIVKDCLNYGSVEVTEESSSLGIGGIAGEVSCAVVSKCGNYGSIKTTVPERYIETTSFTGYFTTALGYQGGILGKEEDTSIVRNCFNVGEVSGAGQYMGGIAGWCKEIENCYNISDITGNTTDFLRGSYPTLGGIVGLGKKVENCYSIGNVSSTASMQKTDDFMAMAYFSNAPAVNCYTMSDTFDAKALGDAFKDDINGINGGYPLLEWQSDAVGDETYPVTFDVTPEGASITVFSDSTMTQEVSMIDDGYQLKSGTYYYKAQLEGYRTETGNFTVSILPVTVRITMSPVSTVSFKTEPSDATVVVSQSGKTVAPVSDGSNVYYLITGGKYDYTVTADGYNGITRDLNVSGDQTVEVSLIKSSQGQVDSSRVIKPDNVPYTISEGGMYDLMPGDFGDKGYVYLDTTEPVTIIGSGTALSSQSQDLFIVSRKEGVNLTLQDVYISNELGRTNMVDFQGKGNTLNFSGTSILDQNTGASGYAMIHVPDSAELTVTGGTLYMYKREQGAGIGGNGGATGGGQTAETNGNITIKDATIFAKNSKQGALIGAGAQAGTQKPGAITIEDSTLYLIPISRGAAIGGSAGSGGASSGSNVSVKNSQITINVDFSGSAIGGGGYDAGNDADGGTLVYDGGSIRTYIDTNAVEEKLWDGITEAGVNGNAAITAKIVNPDGKPLYLLTLDTGKIGDSDYTVKEGNQTVYSGGLHSYSYINESLPKEFQVAIDYTIDNWVDLDDPNLYLYMTGEDHTLDVNGRNVRAVWNEETKSFTVKMEGTADPPEAADKSLLEEVLKAAQDAQKDVRISEDGSDVDPADQWVPQSAADALKEAIEAAQALMDKEDATQEEVDQAIESLKKAQEAFDAEKKVGTKPDHDQICPSKAFTDLDTGKWYHEAIDYVLLKNYFNGVGEGKFEPDGTMTRAMFVTVLGRAAGVEGDRNAHSSFSDVADGKWYTTYVDWAAKNGIVNGYDSETFGTDDFVTREQMAAILYRYARYKGVDVKEADAAKYHTFRDADQVSNYAKVPMIWAVDKGIINGMGDGILAPQETATRSQVAQLIMNFDKLIG